LSTAILIRIVKAHGNGGQEARDVSALLTASLPETRNSDGG
jgi:hypothetical protein